MGVKETMLFDWKWEGIEQVMDWVAVVGAVSAVVLLVVEIIRGVNEKKALSKEHDALSKENSGLSKEHDGLAKEISKEHFALKETLSREQTRLQEKLSDMSHTVVSIDKQLAVAAEREERYTANLTLEQRDIKQSIQQLMALEHQMEVLQSENKTLKAENKMLWEKLQSLQNERHVFRENDQGDYDLEP